MKNNNKMTALQQLRQEKKEVKRSYLQDEERLAESWDNLTNNLGTLAFNSVFKGAKKTVKPKSKGYKESNLSGITSSNMTQSILYGLSTIAPIAWEFAQPMLMRYLMRKVKSAFTFNKDKKDKKKK